MTETPLKRRRRRLAEIPHKQASEVRVVAVPAQYGVIAHNDHLVTTACGEEKPTTLTTRRDDRVRCDRCKAAMVAGDPDARSALITRFLDARNSADRLAVNREIDKREDAAEIYTEIRETIGRRQEEQIRMLDAGQPEQARNFPREP